MGTKLKRLSYIILTSMSIALDSLRIHSEFRTIVWEKQDRRRHFMAPSRQSCVIAIDASAAIAVRTRRRRMETPPDHCGENCGPVADALSGSVLTLQQFQSVGPWGLLRRSCTDGGPGPRTTVFSAVAGHDECHRVRRGRSRETGRRRTTTTRPDHYNAVEDDYNDDDSSPTHVATDDYEYDDTLNNDDDGMITSMPHSWSGIWVMMRMRLTITILRHPHNRRT